MEGGFDMSCEPFRRDEDRQREQPPGPPLVEPAERGPHHPGHPRQPIGYGPLQPRDHRPAQLVGYGAKYGSSEAHPQPAQKQRHPQARERPFNSGNQSKPPYRRQQ